MRQAWYELVVGAAIAVPLLAAAIVKAGEADKAPLPSQTLDFQVVNRQTKAPIAGVNVEIRISQKTKREVTDEQGRCEIEHGAHLEYLSIRASKEGLVPIQVFWGRPNEPILIPSGYTLGMEPGTSIGGVVQNEDGKPIEGATLSLSVGSEYESSIEQVAIHDHLVTTDAQGRWRCDIMPSRLGRVMVRLSHPDYVGDEAYGLRSSPPMDQLRALTAVMVMKKGLSVTGRVLDVNDRPIGQATVAQGAMRLGTGYPSTNTNSDGRFEFKNARPGDLVLTVQAKGYAPDVKQFVAGNDMEPIVFKLEPGHALRGRVVDKAGNPIGGVTVNADGWRGSRLLEWRVDTDLNGRFRWDDAPADEILFDFGKLHYMRVSQRGLTASDQENTITLSSELKIKGRVTDEATGQPIARFIVCPGIDWKSDQPIGWMRQEAKSLAGGAYEFTFTQSYPGHAISVEADGYLPQVSRSFDDGEGEVVCDFALKKGAGLSGRAHLPDGQPAVGANVIVCTPSQTVFIENGRAQPFLNSLSVQTGPDGRFSFPAQTDPYRLAVLHDQGCAQVTPEDLSRSSEVTLQAWGRVEGKVLIGAKPGADEPVRLAFAAPFQPNAPRVDFQCSAVADKDGHFAIEHVPPGKVRVCREIRTNVGNGMFFLMLSNDVPVEVKPGETATVTVGGTGRPVIGKVDVPESVKEKMAGQKLQCYVRSRSSNNGNRTFAAKVEQDGTFQADDVPAGYYTLYCAASAPAAAAHIPMGELVAVVNYPFAVPEMPGGRSDEPLDLGILDMRTPQGAAITPSLKGKSLPDLQRLQLTPSPADVNEKRLLVCFFDLQQRPSRNAVSQLAKQADPLKQKGVVTLIIQASSTDDAALKAWLKEADVPFPIGMIRSDEERTRAVWGVKALPWLILTDRTHRVVAEGFDVGELNERIGE